MGIFNPSTWIFFFEGIVGVTPLNPILIPLVQSFGDLSSERVLPMLFCDIVHSCSNHLKLMALHHLILEWHHTIYIMNAPRINIDSPMHFNLEQECRYPIPARMCLDDLVTIFCLCWSLLLGYTLKAGIQQVITWKPHRTLIELHCKPCMLPWSSSATFSWHNSLIGSAMPITILLRSSTAINHYDFSSNHYHYW
jgi:hypothetical protein